MTCLCGALRLSDWINKPSQGGIWTSLLLSMTAQIICINRYAANPPLKCLFNVLLSYISLVYIFSFILCLSLWNCYCFYLLLTFDHCEIIFYCWSMNFSHLINLFILIFFFLPYMLAIAHNKAGYLSDPPAGFEAVFWLVQGKTELPDNRFLSEEFIETISSSLHRFHWEDSKWRLA